MPSRTRKCRRNCKLKVHFTEPFPFSPSPSLREHLGASSPLLRRRHRVAPSHCALRPYNVILFSWTPAAAHFPALREARMEMQCHSRTSNLSRLQALDGVVVPPTGIISLSRLSAGSHILPHCGPSNIRARVLPLWCRLSMLIPGWAGPSCVGVQPGV
jgi:hypothetical protein